MVKNWPAKHSVPTIARVMNSFLFMKLFSDVILMGASSRNVEGSTMQRR